MINEDWRELKIGDLILSADSGVSLLGEDRTVEQGEATILTLSSVSEGIFRPDQYKVVSSLERKKPSVYPKHDRVLISRSNTLDLVGAAVYVDKDYPNRFLPDLIWQLEPKTEQEFSMHWLCYWLQSGLGRNAIKKIASGSNNSMVKISRAAFFKIVITIPSPSEQRRIADILSTWDRAIDLTTQLIVAKQQYKRGLMQQLLTGKKRFETFVNQPWPLLKAGDIFHTYSKRNNGSEELLSVTQDRGVVPRSMLDTRVVMPANETESYKLVEPGDFIISLRSFQGGIEYSQYKGLVSPAYTVLKPKQPIVDSFYKHLYKSQNFISHLAVAIIGIRDGKQINFEDFATIRLPYPILDEQKRIAEVLDVCDQELSLLNRKLELLKKQKQGLMQQLLTGKVRVKV